MSDLKVVFDLPIDAGAVPNDRFGVYSFRLSLPNDARLGLVPGRDVRKLSEDLALRAERMCKAMSDRNLAGHVASRQGAHLRQRFALSAIPISPGYTAAYLRQLIAELGNDLTAVRFAAAVLRYTLELSPPIYVGMTSAQSFRQRLEQHINGSTQFSGRLKELRISWTELQFVIKPMHVPGRAVYSAERVAQSVLRPKVSIT